MVKFLLMRQCLKKIDENKQGLNFVRCQPIRNPLVPCMARWPHLAGLIWQQYTAT